MTSNSSGRYLWARQPLKFLAQGANFDKLCFQLGFGMLKGGRLESFSNLEFLFVISVVDAGFLQCTILQ